MKSWSVESGLEEHRCVRPQWEVESRNLDPPGPGGATDGRGGGLAAGTLCLRLNPEPGVASHLGAWICIRRFGFHGVQVLFQPWVSGNVLFQFDCRESKNIIWGGVRNPGTSGEHSSILRPDSCSAPCLIFSPSYTDSLSFRLICPNSSRRRASAGPHHLGHPPFIVPCPAPLSSLGRPSCPPDGVKIPIHSPN